ncbi:MAG TPA: hypothetical protein VGL81_29940 [Polyangiaceae bacterium]|jgi:hypothetical protein
MLTHLKAPSFLRRLLLPAAVAGALAFGMVAGESTASAQEVGVEVVPPSPGVGFAWAPGYWGYRAGYGRYWYGGRWARPGYAAGWGHRGGWGGHGYAGHAYGGRGGYHGGGHGGGGHGGGGHGGHR